MCEYCLIDANMFKCIIIPANKVISYVVRLPCRLSIRIRLYPHIKTCSGCFFLCSSFTEEFDYNSLEPSCNMWISMFLIFNIYNYISKTNIYWMRDILQMWNQETWKWPLSLQHTIHYRKKIFQVRLTRHKLELSLLSRSLSITLLLKAGPLRLKQLSNTLKIRL